MPAQTHQSADKIQAWSQKKAQGKTQDDVQDETDDEHNDNYSEPIRIRRIGLIGNDDPADEQDKEQPDPPPEDFERGPVNIPETGMIPEAEKPV